MLNVIGQWFTVTTAGYLPAKYVIHTIGPFYHDGESGDPETLASCYRESIRIGDDHAIQSLAFPFRFRPEVVGCRHLGVQRRRQALSLAESIRTDTASLFFEGHPELGDYQSRHCFSSEDGETMDELMRCADAAAYHAQREGGNCMRAYSEIDAKPKNA